MELQEYYNAHQEKFFNNPEEMLKLQQTNPQLVSFLLKYNCTSTTKEKIRIYLSDQGKTNLGQLDDDQMWTLKE